MTEQKLWIIAIAGELMIAFGSVSSIRAFIAAVGIFMVIDVLVYAAYSAEEEF